MNLVIESKNPFLVQNPEEFVVECRRNKPAWIKEASKSELLTAAMCPSFVTLFKNSLLIKCPSQVDIGIPKGETRIKINCNPEQMEIEGHDLVAQMGQVFSDYISFKIGIKVFLHTDEPCMPLFLNTFPYSPQNVDGLKAMEGILPLNNKLKQKLNINMIIHQQAFKDKLVSGRGVYPIRAGTPLAMLYFPDGMPTIEFRDFDPKVPTVDQARHMKGSYLARMKDWFGG
jgi:hypothetical protein